MISIKDYQRTLEAAQGYCELGMSEDAANREFEGDVVRQQAQRRVWFSATSVVVRRPSE